MFDPFIDFVAQVTTQMENLASKGLRVLEAIDKDSKGWTGTLKNISKVEAVELNRILDKLRGS